MTSKIIRRTRAWIHQPEIWTAENSTAAARYPPDGLSITPTGGNTSSESETVIADVTAGRQSASGTIDLSVRLLRLGSALSVIELASTRTERSWFVWVCVATCYLFATRGPGTARSYETIG